MMPGVPTSLEPAWNSLRCMRNGRAEVVNPGARGKQSKERRWLIHDVLSKRFADRLDRRHHEAIQRTAVSLSTRQPPHLWTPRSHSLGDRRTRTQDHPSKMTDPFVSVIVATRNRAALLRQTLDAICGQRWPAERMEIIVADNGSTDDTRQVVESAGQRADVAALRYLYVAEPGKSNAVNAALQCARGELLAFTDDDVLAEPWWIESLVGAFAETNCDFVTGRILPWWETAPPWWLSRPLYGALSVLDNGETRLAIGAGSGSDVMALGGNTAVRSHVIARLGGLRTDLGSLQGTLRTGEDHEFFLRMVHAGCRGTYEPTAVVRHWVPRQRLTPTYFWRWLYQNGRAVARLESSYPSAVARLLRVPRYLWREAVLNVWRAVRYVVGGDRPSGLAAALRVVWFGGYIREAWLGRMRIASGNRV
jgi:glycosyltransferase involved in cell wall biosynthesis